MSTTTSLTAPADRTPNARPSPPIPLSEEEVSQALKENVDTEIIQKFPKLDKFYADPIYNSQTYCIHSFVPSKGASPDKDGLFGFMKCRGTFQTEGEAMQRSESIIRHIDSYHPLQTAYVGRPFPVAVDSKKFVKDSVEIDVRKKTTQVLSEDVQSKRQDDKQVIADIKKREEKLLSESKEDFVEEPLEHYTMLRTKKAQVSWTYAKTLEKMEDMKRVILRTREEIAEMDTENPEFQNEFFDKYMNAYREAGLDKQKDADENFTKYLVEDLDLGF